MMLQADGFVTDIPSKELKEILNKTKFDLEQTQHRLNIIVSNANSHLVLASEQKKIEIIGNVPFYCRVSMKDLELPAFIKIVHLTKEVFFVAYASFSY